MDSELIAWLPYLIGGALLLALPLGRRILKWWVVLSIGFVLLLAGSEPDLRD